MTTSPCSTGSRSPRHPAYSAAMGSIRATRAAASWPNRSLLHSVRSTAKGTVCDRGSVTTRWSEATAPPCSVDRRPGRVRPDHRRRPPRPLDRPPRSPRPTLPTAAVTAETTAATAATAATVAARWSRRPTHRPPSQRRRRRRRCGHAEPRRHRGACAAQRERRVGAFRTQHRRGGDAVGCGTARRTHRLICP